MNLQHTHLGQPNEALRGRSRDVFPCGSSFAVRHRHGINSVGQSAADMFLEEAGLCASSRATNDAQGATGNLRQRTASDGQKVIRKVPLGELACRVISSPAHESEFDSRRA